MSKIVITLLIVGLVLYVGSTIALMTAVYSRTKNWNTIYYLLKNDNSLKPLKHLTNYEIALFRISQVCRWLVAGWLLLIALVKLFLMLQQ